MSSIILLDVQRYKRIVRHLANLCWISDMAKDMLDILRKCLQVQRMLYV